MAFDHSVWKGGTIALVCLILFTLNVSAWSSAEMQDDMDEKFESKFGSSFDAKFETTVDDNDDSESDDSDRTDRDSTFDSDSGDDSSDSDRDTTRQSDDVTDTAFWADFEERMDNLDSEFDSDSSDSDQDTTRRTDDSTDRSSNDDSSDSDDRGSWADFDRRMNNLDSDFNSDNDDSTHDRTDRNSDDQRNDDTTSDRDTVNPSGSTEAQAEQYLHQYINDERQQRGLSPLQFDSDLQDTAREKSQDMSSRGYFSHNDPEGDNFRDIYNAHGISRSDCRLGAENIARTWFNRNVRTDSGSTVHYDDAQSLADGLRRQWMTSSAHRDAILRERYNSHGIGIEITSSGRVYASEHFCT